MDGVADDVFAKDEIADCVWLRRLRNTAPHFWKYTKPINACNEIGGHTCRCGWIVVGDEVTQPSKIRDCLLRINEPHLSARGGGNSLEVPQDSNQE